jgi:hypothetical protein
MNTLGPVPEESTAQYTALLKDETGAVVPAASLTTLTLTFYDVDTGDAINGRTGQDVLNAHEHTVSAGGVLVWTMLPDDNPIVTVTKGREIHRALYQATWGGDKALNHEVQITVNNLRFVPT